MRESVNEALKLIGKAIEELKEPTYESVEDVISLLTQAVDKLAVGGSTWNEYWCHGTAVKCVGPSVIRQYIVSIAALDTAKECISK